MRKHQRHQEAPHKGEFCAFLKTNLSVGPLSLCVDGTVALCVLASRFGLWRVPLEGTAELETLVLCWHSNAEPWEALRVQVGLHTRRDAVGALEAGPPATKTITAIPEPTKSHTVSHSKSLSQIIIFLLITAHFCWCWDGQAVIAVTTTHSAVISPAKSFGIWRTSVCKCHVNRLSDEFTLLHIYNPPPLILLCCLMRCKWWLRHPFSHSCFLLWRPTIILGGWGHC